MPNPLQTLRKRHAALLYPEAGKPRSPSHKQSKVMRRPTATPLGNPLPQTGSGYPYGLPEDKAPRPRRPDNDFFSPKPPKGKPK